MKYRVFRGFSGNLTFIPDETKPQKKTTVYIDTIPDFSAELAMGFAIGFSFLLFCCSVIVFHVRRKKHWHTAIYCFALATGISLSVASYYVYGGTFSNSYSGSIEGFKYVYKPLACYYMAVFAAVMSFVCILVNVFSTRMMAALDERKLSEFEEHL